MPENLKQKPANLFLWGFMLLLFSCQNSDDTVFGNQHTFIKYIASNPKSSGSSLFPQIIQLSNGNLAMLSITERKNQTNTVVFFILTLIDKGGNKIKELVLEDAPYPSLTYQGQSLSLRLMLKIISGGIYETINKQITVVGTATDTSDGKAISRGFIYNFSPDLTGGVKLVDLSAPNLINTEGISGISFALSNSLNSLYVIASLNRLVGTEFNYDLYFSRIDLFPNLNVRWQKIYGDNLDSDFACKIITFPTSDDFIWAATSYKDNRFSYRLGRINPNGGLVWQQHIKSSVNKGISVSDILYYGNSVVVLGCIGSDLELNSTIYLANFDLDGKKIYEMEFDLGVNGLNASRAYGISLLPTYDNKFIIAGHLQKRGEDDLDMFLLKTEPNGSIIWKRDFRFPGDDLTAGVLGLKDGGFLLYGTSFSEATTGLICLIRTNSLGIVSE